MGAEARCISLSPVSASSRKVAHGDRRSASGWDVGFVAEGVIDDLVVAHLLSLLEGCGERRWIVVRADVDELVVWLALELEDAIVEVALERLSGAPEEPRPRCVTGCRRDGRQSCDAEGGA